MKLYPLLTLILLLPLLMGIAPDVQYLGISKYWNNKDFAVVIRVDDIVSKDGVWEPYTPKKSFTVFSGEIITYLESKYPWLKLSLSVVTNPPLGIMSTEPTNWMWIKHLLEKGHEIGSHSVTHLPKEMWSDPRVRDPSEIIDSVKHIVGNLSIYPEFYAVPGSYVTPTDVTVPYEIGIKTVWTYSKSQLYTDPDPYNWNFTYIDFAYLLNRRTLNTYDLFLHDMWRAGGACLFLTHLHTYDFDNSEQIKDVFNHIAQYIETHNGWSATISELRRYIELSRNIEISEKHIQHLYITRHIYIVRKKIDVESPITLMFRAPPNSIVLKDGKPLMPNFNKYHSINGREGYFYKHGKLYITIYPPAKIEIIVLRLNK